MIKERLQYFFDLIDQEYLFYYGGHFYWKFWHNTHSVCKELGEPRLAGTNCDGYRIIRSSIDAKMFYILEHHLVYAGFYGFRELVDGIGNRLEINHKNGITYDNFPKNLELVTPKQNTAHAIKTGLRKNVMGENSHFC